MKKLFIYLLVAFAVVGTLFLGLKKNIHLDNMQVHETAHFTIYYEALEQETINDIEQKLEANYTSVRQFFGLSEDQRGSIVVYESVGRFQRAYLGIILSLVYGDWASGAAYRDLVLVTSPENPGSQHTYDDILEIIVHEYVHTLVYQQNEMPDIWLDEGMATYLAGQKSNFTAPVPSFEALQQQDMNSFLDNDGYAYSYAYVDYLVSTYGNDKVVDLIKTNDYEGTFGKSQRDVYTDWVSFMTE
ncbi:MAG: hypothetical protein JXB30_12250 [Anaerolineae bacterium]|nr:hypothetical protein [Anaerolineae bacterium]